MWILERFMPLTLSLSHKGRGLIISPPLMGGAGEGEHLMILQKIHLNYF